MSDITEVPPIPPDAGLEEIRKALAQLIENQRVRERDTAGEKAAKFITWGDAEAVGLVIRVGGGSVGTGGGVYTPPDDPLLDLSPPEATTNLQAFSSVAYVMVTVDAPTYPQGGGNGYTEIYAANYAGTGPLPIFDDAVLVGTMTGRSPVLVIDAEPGVEMHFWAGAVTSVGVKQVDTIGPTGGTNGVTATPGLIDSQHIVSLTASKITAGSIGVGEDITSTGFVSGSAGWRIRGNGVAEFSDAVVRGSIYASGGTIGGALIGSNYVQSTNYNGTTLGWRLDNALGKLFAKAGEIAAFTIDGKVLKLGTAALAGTGDGIAMGTDTDSANKLFVGNATKSIYFNGTTLALNGELVDTNQMVPEAATAIDGVSFSTLTSITSTTTGAYQKLVVGTLVFTTTGAKVQFDAQIFFSANITAIFGSCKIYPFIEMDGTELAVGQVRSVSSSGAGEDVQVGGSIPRQVSDIPRMLHTPSAGVHTYKYGLKVWRDDSGDTIEGKAYAGSMIIAELKR